MDAKLRGLLRNMRAAVPALPDAHRAFLLGAAARELLMSPARGRPSALHGRLKRLDARLQRAGVEDWEGCLVLGIVAESELTPRRAGRHAPPEWQDRLLQTSLAMVTADENAAASKTDALERVLELAGATAGLAGGDSTSVARRLRKRRAADRKCENTTAGLLEAPPRRRRE